MRAIILISPNSNELKSIFIQWNNKAKCDFVFPDRLTISVEKGHFFVDSLENGNDYYDEDDIDDVVINNCYFYSICYSEKECMAEFIAYTIFQDNSFLDNDHGKIEKIEKIKKWSLNKLINEFLV